MCQKSDSSIMGEGKENNGKKYWNLKKIERVREKERERDRERDRDRDRERQREIRHRERNNGVKIYNSLKICLHVNSCNKWMIFFKKNAFKTCKKNNTKSHENRNYLCFFFGE